VGDARYVSMEQLQALREEARRLAPSLLVTASYGGDLGRDELRRYLDQAGVDFVAPHRPRDPDSPQQSAEQTRRCLALMKDLGRTVPIHYQEPFRRGYDPRHWEPMGSDFILDLRNARAGGAAGWCFHNGSQKDGPADKPRRSFDMREQSLFEQFDRQERDFLQSLRAGASQQP